MFSAARSTSNCWLDCNDLCPRPRDGAYLKRLKNGAEKLVERFSKWVVKVLRTEIGLLVPFFLTTALVLTFGFIADEVREGSTQSFDRLVMFAFRSSSDNFSSPVGPSWVQEMARDVTSLGSFAVLGLVLVAAVVYLVLARKRASAWLVLIAVVGGVALNSLLKIEFARPRPDLFLPAAKVFTASFPSGHAALSAVTYLTLAAMLGRTIHSRALRNYLLIVALILTLLIGVSRVYLGVHYPTDILAGWCIGSAWALGCWTIMTRLQQEGPIKLPSK